MCAAFTPDKYEGFVSKQSVAQQRLIDQYSGSSADFDIIVVGSGMGGGILADDLVERLAGHGKRMLVLEAGSYLFPTHVYNFCRFPNSEVARQFAVKTFEQSGNMNSEFYIHEQPQLNFGGRSIFWSGLIPRIQPWELGFFPPNARAGIESRLDLAGKKMNESVSMGTIAQQVVQKLHSSPLIHDFAIEETPRALHQPYLNPDATPTNEFFVEPTGVFNTAELLVNQLELRSGGGQNQPLNMLLNHYVDEIKVLPNQRYELDVKNTINDQSKVFTAKHVVLAAGSLESPKILSRSPIVNQVAHQSLIGKGLTDHPTTDSVGGLVTHIHGMHLPRDSHAKIILYSRGRRDGGGVRYPFNVEINLNHEYWHLRENDPTNPRQSIHDQGKSILDLKFSFGNVLDLDNVMGGDDYVPSIQFRNLHHLKDLAENRFRLLAEWNKSFNDIWWTLNEVTHMVFSQFTEDGKTAEPTSWYGQSFNDFGHGTVHHAVGTLRMPWKDRINTGQYSSQSVVNEDLMVKGCNNLHVCDMSIMPFSSAANPVRTLAALALRLSEHLAQQV